MCPKIYTHIHRAQLYIPPTFITENNNTNTIYINKQTPPIEYNINEKKIYSIYNVKLVCIIHYCTAYRRYSLK